MRQSAYPHGRKGYVVDHVHPSEDKVLEAIERLGGHNSGHSEQKQLSDGDGKLLTSTVHSSS